MQGVHALWTFQHFFLGAPGSAGCQEVTVGMPAALTDAHARPTLPYA